MKNLTWLVLGIPILVFPSVLADGTSGPPPPADRCSDNGYVLEPSATQPNPPYAVSTFPEFWVYVWIPSPNPLTPAPYMMVGVKYCNTYLGKVRDCIEAVRTGPLGEIPQACYG
jgi:hypothetical protein